MSACARCGRDYRPMRRGLCKGCYEHKRHLIGWRSSFVDAQPVREHIIALNAAGVGVRRLSELSGVNRKQIQWVLHGRTDRGSPPSKRVAPSTAERLLAISVPETPHQAAADHALIHSYGTNRRLQALVAIGYTQEYLSHRLGIHPSNATILFRGPPKCLRGKRGRVTALTARKVAALYDELQNTPGPSTSAVNRAKRLGWLPPIAWDDDIIDQPWPWLNRQMARHINGSDCHARENGHRDDDRRQQHGSDDHPERVLDDHR